LSFLFTVLVNWFSDRPSGAGQGYRWNLLVIPDKDQSLQEEIPDSFLFQIQVDLNPLDTLGIAHPGPWMAKGFAGRKPGFFNHASLTARSSRGGRLA